MEACRIPLPPTLGLQSVRQLREQLEAAQQAQGPRVILLEGSAEAFCRGLDASELLSAPDPDDRAAAIRGFVGCLRLLRMGKKATLAAVDGPAMGGGVGLLAACDVVLASTRATFALPELLFGLVPAMVLPVVLERMAPQKARLWSLTAHARSSAEALTAGLVDEVVTPERLERAAKRWVRQLGRGQPEAVATLHDFSARVRSLPIDQALAAGGEVTQAATADPAVQRALAGFRSGVSSWEED